jgi:UDP-2,3-diacylglucosamine pyrophosphatase LpxH
MPRSKCSAASARGGTWTRREKKEFPTPVQVHYIPGNHDRLCNATPGIRARVREILGITGGGDRFDNQLLVADPPVLVRHGHEYEFANFSVDNTKRKRFPVTLPAADYDAPAFGDFITVQIASRLPKLFRAHHGDEQILATPLLQRVYDRLIEFDDVRPQAAIFEFILNDPDIADREAAWNAVEPLLRVILNDLSRDPFFRNALKERDAPGPDTIDAVQALLDLKAWKLTRRLPAGLVKWIADRAQGKPGKPPVAFAAREEAILDGRARQLVGGHTHYPAVELIASDAALGERYYVDTGTWRNRVPATPDGKAFGHLKALTYVTVYASGEDAGSGLNDPRGPAGAAPGAPASARLFSMDYWSGVTQRFVR